MTNLNRWVNLMARIYDDGAFQVQIWPNDHIPEHVHVYRAEALIIIVLATLEVRAAYDARPPDIRRAVGIVEQNRARFLAEWRRMHG